MDSDAEHRHLDTEDWERVRNDAGFRDLIARRRRFVIPAAIFFLAYYLALPVLAGFAPALMSRQVVWHVNIAYLFALSQFAMTWIVMALYLRRAGRLDLLEAQIVRRVRNSMR